MKRWLRFALVAALALALCGGGSMSATRQHMPTRGYWGWEMPDGTLLYLTPSNGLFVSYVGGAGMPPVRNIITPYAVADGGHYQRTKTLSPTLTFVVEAVGGTDYGLRLLRSRMIDAVSHHNVGRPPIRIFYFGLAHKLYLDVVYDAGLEGGQLDGVNAEKLAIRFIAPDPYWSDAINTRTGALDSFELLQNVNYISMRDTNGGWSTLGGGMNSTVADLLFDATGNLYAGGDFTTAGGVAANRIAMWDGAAWNALGAGLNGSAYCMAWGPDGSLYVGGTFTTAGGGAANRVARWYNGTWYALGAGCDNTVYDIIVDNNGDVWIVGEFLNAGGAPAAYVAYWDTSASAWIVPGGGLSDGCRAIAKAPDGTLYIGGDFHTDAGVTITLNHIARWNSAWQALSTGMDDGVWTIVISDGGTVYAFGAFLVAGGISASEAAQWNGVAWKAMGAGLTGGQPIVGAGDISPDGTVYVGGNFSLSGLYPIPQSYAFWRDPLWIAGDGSVSGLGISALQFYSDNTLAIGGSFRGWLRYPYYLTINNDGNAKSFPIFTVLGPGRLYHIVNYTTGQRLDFDLDMMVGEVITIDLRTGYKTVMSSARGNLTGKCIGGSLATWALAPGDNYIAFFVYSTLISNGNFETLGGGGADVFASWTETAGTGAIAASATSHSGAWAAQLTAGATINTNVYQDVAVAPGQTLHLEYWTRGDGVNAGRRQIYDQTNGADIVALGSTGITGAAYTLVQHDFVVPAGCLIVRVYLYCPAVNAGVAYFDDVASRVVGHSYSFVPRYMGIDKAAD